MTVYCTIKRILDVLAALALLVLALPLLLLVAFLILVLEGRPVFYCSRRYITPTRSVPILKFRTMVHNATAPEFRLRERFMRGPYLDIPRNCEAYTPIGRLLERSQIVELPQLINILLHGMSFIGNRPLPYENVQLLRQYDGWEERFHSPAGISGIAQVVGKLNLEPEERLHLECAYSKVYRGGNVLWCDIVIVLYTLYVVVLGRNISPERAYRLLTAAKPLRVQYSRSTE